MRDEFEEDEAVSVREEEGSSGIFIPNQKVRVLLHPNIGAG